MDEQNPNPTPTPAPAAPAPTGIAARIEGIVREHHSHLSEDQRAMVVAIATAQRWSGDISEKLDKAVAAFGDPVSYRPGRPAGRPFDPGAPSGGPAARLPLDPLRIDQSTVDAMTPAQAKEWYDAYIASGGKPQHPFKAAREAERVAKSGEMARMVSVAIQEALGKLR